MKHTRFVIGVIGIAVAAAMTFAQGPPLQRRREHSPPPRAGASRRRRLCSRTCRAATIAGMQSPLLRSYSPVTKARLLKPEDRNWLQIRRTYDGWGYSPLDKITPANVSRLKMVWSAKTDEVGSHQAPPLINNGVMFISTPNNQVAAYDAKTGTLLWRYKTRAPGRRRLSRIHPTAGSRSTATRSTTAPAKRSSSRSTRRPAKRCGPKEVYDNKINYYITMAPLAADGKILDRRLRR